MVRGLGSEDGQPRHIFGPGENGAAEIGTSGQHRSSQARWFVRTTQRCVAFHGRNFYMLQGVCVEMICRFQAQHSVICPRFSLRSSVGVTIIFGVMLRHGSRSFEQIQPLTLVDPSDPKTPRLL